MQFKLFFETVAYLKPKQVVYQVLARISKPKIKVVVAPEIKHTQAITAPIIKKTCYDGEDFCFLNVSDLFHSWNQVNHGMLWAYNINYMDWLGQKGIRIDEIKKWIDIFIDDLPFNKVGLDPYPIALRTINWIKAFTQYPECRNAHRNNSLYSQILLLEQKLEYRLMGNHLLEEAFALYIAAIYFDDDRLYQKASKLLICQLREQILDDGAHYEQSPMYHCIILDRLLDCINWGSHINNTDIYILRDYSEKMLGHLKSIIWEDGSIPLLNDSAYGIAPTSSQLFDYAKRMGLSWSKIPMKECGYRKMNNIHLEAIIDVGNITASYQPGHTHADTFNYELRIDGKPFIVDTGISTYDKTSRRQYERSTAAHNCVVVNEQDSSHVWGGFRVGHRARVHLQKDTASEIVASHDGFKKICLRKFKMTDDSFIIEDQYDSDAVSYIHLAKNADMCRIKIEGAKKIEIEDNHYSTEYNCFIPGRVIRIYFNGNLKFTIQ